MSDTNTENEMICVFDEDSAERLVALVYDMASLVDTLFWNRRTPTRKSQEPEMRTIQRLEADFKTWRELDAIF